MGIADWLYLQPIEALRGTDKLSKVVRSTTFESLSEFYNSAKRCIAFASLVNPRAERRRFAPPLCSWVLICPDSKW